jgi:hypothetical protein
MRTRLFGAAMILGLASLAFAVPAYAQMNIMAPNIKYQTQEEVDQALQQEKDYKKTMQKMPDQKSGSTDPWGTVRGSNTGSAQADPKTKKKKTSTTQ